jgi:putative flippase GtrA
MRELLQRWIAFNGVGGLGIVVQLGLLMILLRHFGIPYLWATGLAVECALLHNFLWHQRWTWRDRPSRSVSDIAQRLWRFHALNGFVSLAGNLSIARLLTGEFQADPLASNIVAIMVCSMLNFAASELLVFRRIGTAVLMLMVALPAAAATGPVEAELRAPTLKAWSAYERQVDDRASAASAGGTPFFALDAYGIKDWRTTAKAGGVAMHRLDGPGPGRGAPDVPEGKIHHWAGAVFVPGMTVDAVLEHLSKYAGRESEHYEDVIASRLLSRDGDTHRVFLKLRRTKFSVTSTYNTEHSVVYRRIGASRAAARSASTKIAELADAGSPQERERPEGRDHGYLWRLNAYWRYEAMDGGVLIECESISLSRGVPMLLKIFISGVVEGIARESLEKTLTGLKRALVKTTAT